jgi:hypothetical protein
MVVSWGNHVQILEMGLAAVVDQAAQASSAAPRERASQPQPGRRAVVRVQREFELGAPVIAIAWLTSGRA